MNPLIGFKKASPGPSRLVGAGLCFALALSNRNTAGSVPF